MKAPRILYRSSVAVLASGFFAAAALAGPGPQYWNRPAAKPAPKPEAPKTEVPIDGKCAGCKTTRIWVISDRGPSGKGAPGASVVGKKHECTRCTGSIATEKGKTTDTMKHDAACSPALCCR
jgi:hypothetical protein